MRRSGGGAPRLTPHRICAIRARLTSADRPFSILFMSHDWRIPHDLKCPASSHLETLECPRSSLIVGRGERPHPAAPAREPSSVASHHHHRQDVPALRRPAALRGAVPLLPRQLHRPGASRQAFQAVVCLLDPRGRLRWVRARRRCGRGCWRDSVTLAVDACSQQPYTLAAGAPWPGHSKTNLFLKRTCPYSLFLRVPRLPSSRRSCRAAVADEPASPRRRSRNSRMATKVRGPTGSYCAVLN